MKPVRIQRKRTKGYNMQEHSKSINGLDAVYVGRPGKYGNPYKVVKKSPRLVQIYCTAHHSQNCIFPTASVACHVSNANYQLTRLYSEWCEGFTKEWVEKMKKDLAGKNLACFCRLDQPCHAEILLELANAD